MNDELDRMMGALRSPATSEELAGESADVDRMHHAHQSKGPTMFTSRRTRVATLIAAGVLGFGGVAAAGPAALQMMTEEPAAEETVVEEPVVEEPVVEEPVAEEPVVEEPVVEEPVVEEPVVEEDGGVATEEVEKAAEVEEEEPAPMPVMLDDPATDFFDESQCLPGNHGATVSAVARGEFQYYERDENGMLTDKVVEVAVRDAARSSCGKDFEGVDPTEEEPVEPEEAEELEVEEIDEPEEPKGPPAHAGGKDKGKPDHAGGKDKGKPAHAGGPPAHAGGKGKGRG